MFIEAAMRGRGYDITTQLVQLGPVLLVIDLSEEAANWERLVTAAKTNPATRRIPILGIGPHEAALRAHAAGCDVEMTADAFKLRIQAGAWPRMRASTTGPNSPDRQPCPCRRPPGSPSPSSTPANTSSSTSVLTLQPMLVYEQQHHRESYNKNTYHLYVQNNKYLVNLKL